MMLLLLKTVCIFALSISLGNADEEVFLTIPQGTLVGLKKITVLHNQTYYSFKGIPYTQPRTGERKFDPPSPPDPWEGIWNATEHQEICVQYNTIFENLEGEEDCLYLNIYTPSLKDDACRPVMVWFHGWYFSFGMANYDYYGGDYLVEQDVVVVTVAYRLGPLGFLCTQDESSPGNMGLKDQVYGLRWIRDNIKYFGGCSDKVTIFGQDSGGVSVVFHMLSPMSRGLFHRAITQSGAITDYWAFNHTPLEGAFRLGRNLGIHTNSTKELVDTLKKMSGKQIFLAAKDFYRTKTKPTSELYYDLYFVPCADVKTEGEEQFLSDEPMRLLQEGDFADVPFLSGVNLDEGAYLFTTVADVTQLLKGKDRTFRENFAVRFTMGLRDPKKRSQVYDEIYKFYFNNTPLEDVSLQQMIPLGADIVYNTHHHMMITIMNHRLKSNVYRYVFAYRSDDGFLRPLSNAGNASTHWDELEFMFFIDAFAAIPEPGSNAYRILLQVSKMWANFARDGDPTSVMDEHVKTKWLPMENKNNILYIGLKSEIRNTFFPERMNFWMSKFKSVLGKFVNILI